MNNIICFLQRMFINLSWKNLLILSLAPLCSFSSANESYTLDLCNTDVSLNTYSPEYIYIYIYIHFNKIRFYTEESIWFKIYLVNDENNILGTNSKVVYVDLIDPKNKKVETKIIKIKDGLGTGNIFLPFNLIKGEYTVRAYTNYMRNFDNTCFFKKKLYINSRYSYNKKALSKNTGINNSKLDLKFYPEGGNLVSGFNNRIAFKAIDGNGIGVDLKGEIIDETGEKIKQFNTSKFGMGLFHLVPQKGKNYKASILHGNKKLSFNLPQPLNKWVIMRVIEYPDHFRVNIESSFEEGMNNYKLVAKQNSGASYTSEINGNKFKCITKILKKNLQKGIIKFTLFDPNNKPLAERLVFNERKKIILK